MKKIKFLNRSLGIAVIPIIVCTLIIAYGITSCIVAQSNEKVFEAYELRINGKADSAKIILEKVLSSDSTNAMAWYELCRTNEHLGMANPRTIKESMDEALRCINLAVQNDPDNALYLSYKGGVETLQFYLAMQMGNENAVEYLAKLEDTYKSVFELDPTYYENKLTLIEFFGGLPPEMGGDPEKAEKYAGELERADMIAGAKARELLMAEDADYETFWKEIIEKNNKNADAHQALGRVYLFVGNIDEATICYQKAIDLDPSKNDLYLDLGRFYMMMAMQNPALTDSVAPLVEKEFNKFLNFTPEPKNPMKAWAYSILSMINRRTGNVEVADKFLIMAKELDPFFSPISGKPGIKLYSPPDVVVHDQGYYLSPF
ncbi:MAG: tetratricopeptide repeat protein [Bacteroidales bacterium]|nr:tetratricopeptide repeat protein [Bacteroidales bacterium]